MFNAGPTSGQRSEVVGQSVLPQSLPLTSDFTFSPSSPTVGETITFTATTSGGRAPYFYSWNFGDGSGPGPGNPVTHTYSVAGSFNVTETVNDSSGNTATVRHTVLVSTPVLNVTITVTPNPPIAGQTATLSANVTGGTPPYTYSWSFGDGSSGTGNPVTHSYPVKGSFTTSVTVTDSSTPPFSQQVSKAVTVFPMTLTAMFGFAPGNPVVGSPVTFGANVTGGTAPYSDSWTFGDGTSGLGSPTSHTYSAQGTYTVTLRVQDGNANTASHSMSVTVSPPPLTAGFTFSPASPVINQSVTFNAAVSGGTAPYTFSWNFGDTGTGAGNPANHSYASAASFTVILTVTDANAMTATATRVVTVSVPPLSVDFGPTTTLVGNTTFIASISGGVSPYSCSWSFGDLTPSQAGCNPVHGYTSTGSFTVTLTVTDSHSTVKTATHSESVQAAPSISKLAFNHNVKSVSGTGTQTFTITVTNPSTLTINVQVSLTVCDGTGTCSPAIIESGTVGPSSSIILTATFTGAPGKYTFRATLTYSATLPVPGGNTTLVGIGNNVSGKFSIS